MERNLEQRERGGAEGKKIGDMSYDCFEWREIW